jgi:hypothetical protein
MYTLHSQHPQMSFRPSTDPGRAKLFKPHNRTLSLCCFTISYSYFSSFTMAPIPTPPSILGALAPFLLFALFVSFIVILMLLLEIPAFVARPGYFIADFLGLIPESRSTSLARFTVTCTCIAVCLMAFFYACTLYLRSQS